MDIDAQRGDKTPVGGNTNDIIIIPDTLNFGILHPDESKSIEFILVNQRNKDLDILQLEVINFDYIFDINDFQPITLQRNGSGEDSISYSISVSNNSEYGIYIDSMYVNDFRNPDLKLLLTTPAVYAKDIDFGTVEIGEDVGSTFLTIYNLSDSEVQIQDIIISNNVFDLKPNLNDFIIAPNSSIERIITFNPLDNILYESAINFKIDRDLPFDGEIKLTGQGTY
jgi:hypothetical protein